MREIFLKIDEENAPYPSVAGPNSELFFMGFAFEVELVLVGVCEIRGANITMPSQRGTLHAPILHAEKFPVSRTVLAHRFHLQRDKNEEDETEGGTTMRLKVQFKII